MSLIMFPVRFSTVRKPFQQKTDNNKGFKVKNNIHGTCTTQTSKQALTEAIQSYHHGKR